MKSHKEPHLATGLHIYADGCCEPNPGVGGWAFIVLRDGQKVAHDFSGAATATNNQMELTSLLQALTWISEHATGEPVTVWSDSRYAVDGANSWRHKWQAKGWVRKGDKPIANLDLWKKIDSALALQPLTIVQWCRGHSGIPGNERADELASDGRREFQDAMDKGIDVAALLLDENCSPITGGETWITLAI